MSKIVTISFLADDDFNESQIESGFSAAFPNTKQFNRAFRSKPIHLNAPENYDAKKIKSIVIKAKDLYGDSHTESMRNLYNIFQYWSGISFCGKIKRFFGFNDFVVVDVDMTTSSSSDPKKRKVFESLLFDVVEGVFFKTQNKKYEGLGRNFVSMEISENDAVFIVKNIIASNIQTYNL